MAKLDPTELREEIDVLCAELRQVRSTIDHLEGELADLNEELAPAKSEQSAVMSAILASHGGPGRYARSGIEVRVPLFERLMDIAAVWGPTRQLRARTYTEFEINTRLAKKIQRQIDRLEKQLEKRKSR